MTAGRDRPVVLVVDDDADIREVLSLILQMHGLDVIEASGGSEALSSMRKTRISLVLLDLMMPGMNGADVLDAMKQDPELATVPVIVVSGDRCAVQTAADVGAKSCLLKPVELPDLLREVRRFITLDAGASPPATATSRT